MQPDCAELTWVVMNRRLLVLVLVASAIGAGAVIGCDQKLETGYEPHRLNASDAERRGYYAPAFAPAPEKGGGTPVMPNIGQP